MTIVFNEKIKKRLMRLTVKNNSLLVDFREGSPSVVVRRLFVGQFSEISDVLLSKIDISIESTGPPSGGPLESILSVSLSYKQTSIQFFNHFFQI